ncbi:T9SS type A sorting domain-containing protein [Xanthomarina sp. GH4-25]|uniref:T9SS type A sorting domain-containing protein n=1 Tax=Xanthomarina sp. GH4-25 TaxID=3349335 RepID=UPI003878150F
MKKTLLLLTLSLFIGNSFAQTVWSSYKTIDSDPGENPYTIASGMLNGGAYPDLVVGTYVGNKILVYMNNEDGTFASSVEVATLANISSVTIADIDGVNGNDIIASSYSADGGKLVWYANDGSGNFSATENVISSDVDGAGTVFAGLINADAFMDVAVSAFDGDKVVWFSNDGAGTFSGGEQNINGAITEPGDFDMKDFDGDGDLDAVIATAAWGAGIIDVYYNDGTGIFTIDPNNVSNSGNTYLYDVDFVDVDNDGALDILVSDSYGTFSWYKRNDMDGTYSEIVITSSIPNPGISESEDMDNDGKKDIVLSNGATGGDDIVWMKSIGVPPTTLDVQTTIDGSGIQKQVYAMTIADFDNDGDLDIASISYQAPNDGVYWFENLLETLGVPENELAQTIRMYPNPTSDLIHFNGITTETMNVSVYDVLGKQIINQSINPKVALDVSKLQNGLYVLKLDNSNTSFKFVKE